MTTNSNWTLVGDVGGAGGYHVGDEAMMEANLDLFRAVAPQARLTVVSGDPAYSASGLGVDAVPRLGFDRCVDDDQREALLATLAPGGTMPLPEAFERLQSRTDGLVISGGGNLTSFWPNFIYERIAFCRQAASVGAPIVVLGQTLGPWLAPRHRELVQEMMALATWVGVREAPSFALALELGAPMERLSYQLDDAAGLGRDGAAPELPFDPGLPWIAITLHPIADPLADDPAWPRLAAQLQSLSAQTGCRLVFIPHAKAAPALGAPWSDEDVGRALGRHLPPGTLVELPVLRAREVAALTARARMIVSSRYHPIVFGLASSVPCLAVWADEYTRVKLHGALSHYGCGQDMCSSQDAKDGAIETGALALWSRIQHFRSTLDARRMTIEADERARREALRALVAQRGPVAVPLPERLHGALAESLAQARSHFLRRADAGHAQPAEVPPVPPAVEIPLRTSLSDADWEAFQRDGFLPLGPVLDAVGVRALQARADALARGWMVNPAVHVEHESVQPGADAGAPEVVQENLRPYAGLRGLEADDLFRTAIDLPLWRSICSGVYGAHAGVAIASARLTNTTLLGGAEGRWHQVAVGAEPLDRDPLLSVWVLLDPPTPGSGGLEVIRRSHRTGWLGTEGGAVSDADVASQYDAANFVEVDAQPGEAVLLHNWLIRRPGVNPSSKPRRAFGMSLVDARTRNLATGQRFPWIHGPRLVGDDPYVSRLAEERDAALQASMRAQALALEESLATIDRLQRGFETASVRLSAATLDIDDLREQKRRLEAAGSQKHQEFLAMSARLAELVANGPHTELERLREHLAAAHQESERLRAAMQQLQSDSAFLAHRLEATYASRSWRITRPLRGVSTLVRG